MSDDLGSCLYRALIPATKSRQLFIGQRLRFLVDCFFVVVVAIIIAVIDNIDDKNSSIFDFSVVI